MTAFRSLLLATAFIAAAASTPALADVIAYTTPSGTSANQSYALGFGMDFQPKQAVTVTQLGLFSPSGFTAPATAPDYVTLFNNAGTVLAQLTFSAASQGSLFAGSADYFKALSAPVLLTAGSTYTIAAFYTNGTDRLANAGAGATPPAETGSAYLTYTGGGRYGGATANSYPTTLDTGPANRYSAATFAFVPASIPEPLSLGLLGTGLCLVGLMRRRAA